MKKLLVIIIVLFVFSACRENEDYIETMPIEDPIVATDTIIDETLTVEFNN